MRPPKLIKPYVTTFAKKVVRAETVNLQYVRSTPLAAAQQRDCFAIVERQVAEFGGTSLVGWAIWEFPRVFIEAEFHAIWQSPDGTLLDLTPRHLPTPRILFALEPRRQYLGAQLDNVRQSLTRDKDVDQLLALHAEIFRLTHKLNGEGYYGTVAEPPEVSVLKAQSDWLCKKLFDRYGPWTAEAS